MLLKDIMTKDVLTLSPNDSLEKQQNYLLIMESVGHQ